MDAAEGNSADSTVTCPPCASEVNGQKHHVKFLEPDSSADSERPLPAPVKEKKQSGKVPLEVERKFMVPEDYEERIKTLGGMKLKEQTFRDEYFDTEDYQLTLGDMWLRARDGQWQFKYPPESREDRTSTSQYHETESEKVILQTIAAPLGLDLGSDVAFEDVVTSRLHVIAGVTTTRITYRVDGIQVTVDSTDTGFSVGEIEVMVKDAEKLGDAISNIEGLASKLGLKPLYGFDTTSLLPVPAPDISLD